MSIKTLAQSQDISAQITKLVLGVFALTALAQIKFYLPLSPVPVTGQTFGVALLSLILGRKLAVGSVASYIALGFAGAPIFAGFQVGLLGPTVGYLAGMLVASFVVGGLSDRGFNKSFSKALTATYAGSACVFTFGLLGLSFFVPNNELLFLGLFPFLAGDLVKNLAAATIATKFFKS
ncbi:MAG: biotin transporter BioY [Bdellovibrionota bacterium]|nr:biotin transporter BioY [Bdellovibrionota bacterium]